jgi:hypothetical protein
MMAMRAIVDRVNFMTEDRSTIVYHLLNAEVFRSGMGWVSSWTLTQVLMRLESLRRVEGCMVALVSLSLVERSPLCLKYYMI